MSRPARRLKDAADFTSRTLSSKYIAAMITTRSGVIEPRAVPSDRVQGGQRGGLDNYPETSLDSLQLSCKFTCMRITFEVKERLAMTGTKIALIADDLTGALDSAAPFALAGCRTLVATGPDHLAATLARGAEVVAVSLGSRELTAQQAAILAGQAAAALAAIPTLFKKIDSRMKGHVQAEVAAVLAATKRKRVTLCPAIPELGRVVRGGRLIGAGVPAPITVEGAIALPPGVLGDFPDAESAEDLDQIVGAAGAGLLVGARGLAAALARRVAVRQQPGFAPGLPLTFVVGSRDPITLRQVERLRQGATVGWMACPDGEVPALPPQGPVMILQATPGRGAEGHEVASRLARGVVAQAGRSRTLLLTGGETAAATLAALGIGTLDLLGEIEAGMPVSRGLDLPDGPFLVTKSGGFGDDNCLLRLLNLAANPK